MRLTTKIILASAGLLVSVGATAADTKCINIYYDQIPYSTPIYIESRLDAISLQNLLGHFPQYQQYVSPIHSYKPNEINRCQATFYLGSTESNRIPKSFADDFAATSKSVVWVKSNVQNLGSANLKRIWQVEYDKVYDIDPKELDPKKLPGFYRFFTYKGEVFEKYGAYDENHKQFLAGAEIVGLKPTGGVENAQVVSWAMHSANKSKIPYILRNKNWWYVADMPFSYITEGDRYQIFADILFDVLNEQPDEKRYAFVRVEDVSAATNITYIKKLRDMFTSLKVPYAISLIPIYTDPLHAYNAGHHLEMTRRLYFIDALRKNVEKGASLLMHGVTHQYNSRKNPFSGVSAEDYEFWDQVGHHPIAEDSVDYIVQRVENGAALIQNAGFTISAWLTPHYHASALDISLFGQLFVWTVGRNDYWVSKVCHLNRLPKNLTLDQGKVNPETDKQRLEILAPLTVATAAGDFTDAQHFPYVIYGDYYDVRIIPENLSYIQPFVSNQVSVLRGVDDLLRDAKRNRVLRDTWASFYIHPILLWPKDKGGLGKFDGDTSEIERLIKGIQALGYEFIDLKTWQPAHFKEKRPQPIELEPILGECGG